MDPGEASQPLKPSSTTPPQHHVLLRGEHEDDDGSRDDMSATQAPHCTASSSAASSSLPKRSKLPPACSLSSRGVFEPLCGAGGEEATGAASSAHCTRTSVPSEVRRDSGAGLRSHSPMADDNDGLCSLSLNAVGVSQDTFPIFRPMRNHSVIATQGRRYKSVADDFAPNRSFYPFAESLPFPPSASANPPRANDKRSGEKARDSGLPGESSAASRKDVDPCTSGGRENVVRAYLRGEIPEDRTNDANDPINNYTYFVGVSEADMSSEESTSMEEEAGYHLQEDQRALAREPCGLPSPGSFADSTFSKLSNVLPTNRSARLPDVNEAEKFVETLKRSFSMQPNRSTSVSLAPTMQNESVASGGGEEKLNDGRSTSCGELLCSIAFPVADGASKGAMRDPDFAFEEENAAANHMLQPMHEALHCVSRENLDDDTVSYNAVWESIKSEAFTRSIFFSLRITIFAVFPTYMLLEHPKTKNWFVSGALFPLVAGLFVRSTVGAMMYMVALGLQNVAFFLTCGVVMNAVGAVNSVSGWWCGMIFISLGAGMLGDLPSKRLMMVYTIIVLQLEHSPGGEALTFPCHFALEITMAIGFATLAAILPYPSFTYQQANEGIHSLHKLYGAGLGNAMKSFWAPVKMDAKMALSQIPFEKISTLTANVLMAINFTSYEPIEFNLNNTLRSERLAMLQRIKTHIYAMSAASEQRLSNTHAIHRNQVRREIKEFETRLQGPAMKLAGEVMKVLVQIGAYIEPKDVVAFVNFDALAETATIFADVIEQERMEMLFLRKLAEEETNACLQCFAFHFSLIDIALELQRFEQAMKNFNPSQYPSLFQRALKFFFLDLWHSFWDELPHRLLLDRPYDIRLLKDAVRYTGAFAVACAFTLNYDSDNVYYFGMAILLRLAQQTASETLAIGVNRICGLCIGASLAYITYSKTHNIAEMTMLSMTWCFIAMSLSQHPTYGFGAQYVLVTSIAGLRLAPTPSLLLTRITDNVFAFISYYIICTFVFPVDPIRVQWNTRTKCFISMNELAQTIVTLGCAPITMDGKEVDFLIAKARATVASQKLLLKSYAVWMGKSSTEPTLRGGIYPAAACARLRIHLNEIMSLEEALLVGVTRLHRPRDQPPNVVLRDMMELTRPFLLDAGRLIYQIFQSFIDATERHRAWSMEELLHLLWKSQLACRSLHHVTGNIQRNFYAAILQVSTPDKEMLNVYLNSSEVEDALMKDVDPSLLLNEETDALVKRILAMSFHMAKDAVISHDDLQAFNAIIIVFELLLKTLSQLLPPMIEIYEFEKSRHINLSK
ncbi:hypothetical protein ABL78_0031 [Leptomonas seymouri]|uniref:Integral membrane bound transporter domain-containing protein n=1 Tax=Leptomonas seymouri TaxID=5684 RepID=A0A0N1PEK4_LEPSE|nr:hypothetical protein ABL78_0031 [Leptomonas seymouri]|eukprot:KPI90798.1 hypothetical protein ABL78_0031 [Leptomonas seymouri]